MKKLPYVKIENMISERSNRPVANQFIINTNNGTFFQSYRSVIALRQDGKTYLDKDTWDYSVTTGKYRNIFLGETKKKTERKIKDGTYKLVDLNRN